jgi:23S rRNA pseudouridine2605 synthase
MKERIAKRIAHLGYCSRRDAEKLILMGEVKVNGILIETPAFLVDKKDKISISGEVLKGDSKAVLYAYYKPAGLVCSQKDELGRQTIYDDLDPELPRLVYVGRLDINSEGLLLLTNKPDIAEKLTSKLNSFKRVYKVRAFGRITQNELENLAMGLTIDGIYYKPIVANLLSTKNSNCWIEFSITEGKNREIRKICEYLNLQVNRLIRISFGPYKLNNMQEGELLEVDLGLISKILQ